MHLEVSHKLASRSETDEIGCLPSVTLCEIIQQYIKKKKKLNRNNEFLYSQWEKKKSKIIHKKLPLPTKGTKIPNTIFKTEQICKVLNELRQFLLY